MPSRGDSGATLRHAQRVTGQVSALTSMIGTGRPFNEIAQQLLAARGSLDSLLVRLTEMELRGCITDPASRDAIEGLLRAALGRAAHGRLPIPPSPRRPMTRPRTTLHQEGSTLT